MTFEDWRAAYPLKTEDYINMMEGEEERIYFCKVFGQEAASEERQLTISLKIGLARHLYNGT